MVRLHLHAFYCPIAQLVERMTVNHDVAGSSPAGTVPNHTLAVWLFLFTGLFRESVNTPYVYDITAVR